MEILRRKTDEVSYPLGETDQFLKKNCQIVTPRRW